jgi:uncharacterized membrane protein YfcA
VRSLFRWALLRWPKEPTDSLGGPRTARVTSHTQTDRAATTGSYRMDARAHWLAALVVAPFVALGGYGGILALGAVPELWLVVLTAVPFALWRHRVHRRTRQRTGSVR